MKDYRIEIKVKNNLLWQAMQAKGIATAADLSRLSGVPQAEIGKYLNLKKGIFNKFGDFRPSFETLCSFFNLMPIELYPEEQMTDPILNNKRVIEADANQLMHLGHTELDPTEIIRLDQRAEAVHKMLGSITASERKVVELKHGFYGEEKTFAEIGKEFNVSAGRVAQIYYKALRKCQYGERLEFSGFDWRTMDLVE